MRLIKQGCVIIGIWLSCSLFVLVLHPEPPCVSQKWEIRENWTTQLVSGIWKRPICMYKFAITGEFLPDQFDLPTCHRVLALFLAIALFFAVAIALPALALFLTIAIALAAFALALFLAIALFVSVAIALAALRPRNCPLHRPPPSLPPPLPSLLPLPSPSLARHLVVAIALAAIALFVARHPHCRRHCKADCCIVVVVASQIDVVVVIASPPSRTYQPL